MQSKIIKKLKSAFSYSLKLFILTSFLLSQSFIAEIFLYQNNPNIKSTNIAKANYSDYWYNTNWSYRKPITIHANQVSHTTEASQSNFPVLISLTSPDLKTTSHSGKVQNDPNGYDIIFVGQDGTTQTQLDHEMEKYDPTTGEIVAWVKIPVLSSVSDTTFYIYYGNSAINATQEHKNNVWNDGTGNHFKGVWHLGDTPSGHAVGDYKDSTVNVNYSTNTTNEPIATTFGKIDGAQRFNGSSQYLDVGQNGSLNVTNGFTVSAWVNLNNNTQTNFARVFDKFNGGIPGSGYGLSIYSSGGIEKASMFARTSGAYFDISGVAALPASGWSHIVATFDSSHIYIYVNGILDWQQSTNGQPIITNAYSAHIGDGIGGGGFFNGLIDEIEVSDIARSTDWIRTGYNNQSSPSSFYNLGAEEDTSPPILSQVTPIPTPTNNATPSYTFNSTKSGTITYVGDCASSTTSANSGNNIVTFNTLSAGSHSNCIITVRDGLGNQSNNLAVTNFTVNAVTSVYVVPTMTDNKILPKSSISSSYISDTISTQVSLGEYKSASFVVNSNVGVSSLQVETSNLVGGGNIISSNAVDIKTVKCWYQGGYHITDYSVQGRYLTPELLLNDDSLISVDGDDLSQYNATNPNGKNYLKINGSYIDISSSTQTNGNPDVISISDRPVQDAATLQPVNLPANYNKQFWITLHVPDGTPAGSYSGTIDLKNGAQTIKSLNVNIQVLPIELPEPNIEYGIYYRGVINGNGSISSESKTVQQYMAEMQDMRLHGVTNPTIYPFNTDSNLLQELSIRQQAGMDNTNMYSVWGIANASSIPYYKNLTAPYGVVNIYQYGPDETNLNDSTHRAAINDVHNAGGKYMDAQSVSQADSVADILDLAVVSGLSSTLADKYHSYGHKIYSYGNPQIVAEYPKTFRLNYGFKLWQNDYDGAMDYAYQYGYGDIWNDFDFNTYRDHMFAYPTANGVIDTIQWEGFREGVNDMRYLAALQNAIATASNSNDVRVIEAKNYLANLKNSDLTTQDNQDLDAIRSHIINYILSLQSPAYSLTINQGTDSGFYAQGRKVTITANVPQSGMVFNKWIGDTQYIDNVNSASATVTMPSHATSLTATYTSSWYNSNWSYRGMITIDHNKIYSTSQINFPVLVSLNDNNLKTVANGGKVQKINGDDIIFILPDDTPLNYEIESYDGTTGNLVAWVKIPSLSAFIGTSFYIYYGKDYTIANTQSNINTTWNSNFKGVWHLGETGVIHAGDYKDSTANANNSANTGNQPTRIDSSQIGNAQSFNGTSSYLDVGQNGSLDVTNAFTVSAWINLNNNTPASLSRIFDKFNGGFPGSGYSMLMNSDKKITMFARTAGADEVLTSSSSVPSSGWVYIVETFDSSARSIYINGMLDRHSASNGQSIITNSYSAHIGNSISNNAFFNGSLDEVRISDTARSADWIKTEYNNQSSPSTFSTLSSEETILSPTITSLTANLPNGTYGTGTTIPITINFSKDVTSTGNITLTLNTIPQRTCSFTITNNNSATCNYTIQGGDSATNLNATISGTIQDQFGNPLTNFTPTSNLSDNTTININTSSSPFTPPTKPNITNINITVLDNGTTTFNLPSNITQIAISRTPDFANVSWQDFDQDKFSHINETQETLYLKFRTNEGAVSDTIIITPQTSINNTISLTDGDIIQCKSSNDPNAVYIVKIIGTKTYIRHITSIRIFNYYKHLKWENLKQVDSLTPFSLSSWIRVNTGTNGLPKAEDKVYEINGDQTKHWINMTSNQFLSHGGSDEAIYTVNTGELNLYSAGADVVSL